MVSSLPSDFFASVSSMEDWGRNGGFSVRVIVGAAFTAEINLKRLRFWLSLEGRRRVVSILSLEAFSTLPNGYTKIVICLRGRPCHFPLSSRGKCLPHLWNQTRKVTAYFLSQVTFSASASLPCAPEEREERCWRATERDRTVRRKSTVDKQGFA